MGCHHIPDILDDPEGRSCLAAEPALTPADGLPPITPEDRDRLPELGGLPIPDIPRPEASPSDPPDMPDDDPIPDRVLVPDRLDVPGIDPMPPGALTPDMPPPPCIPAIPPRPGSPSGRGPGGNPVGPYP